MPTLWVISTAESFARPLREDWVFLLEEAAGAEVYQKYTCFVDAAEHPTHPYATPLDEKKLIELLFSATSVLHG
jgi:hypothetical protein